MSEHTESMREIHLPSSGSQPHFIQGWVRRRSRGLDLPEIHRRKWIQEKLMSMLWNHKANENLHHWVRNWLSAKYKI